MAIFSGKNVERLVYISAIFVLSSLLIYTSFMSSNSGSSSSFCPTTAVPQQRTDVKVSSSSSEKTTIETSKSQQNENEENLATPDKDDGTPNSSKTISSTHQHQQGNNILPVDSLAYKLLQNKQDSEEFYSKSGPIGHARYIHPSLQNFRFSKLLTSIETVAMSRDGKWSSLGVLSPSNGQPDQPYDQCKPTTETADEQIFGFTSRQRRKHGKPPIKSNPIPKECLEKIEPLNAKIPLQSVQSMKLGTFPLPNEHSKCALNRRRFQKHESKLHSAALDDKEAERRKKQDTKFLAATCPDVLESKLGRGRKVLIDLGARHYLSSTQWFRDNYLPKAVAKDFTVHGFDVANKWSYSFQFDKKATFHAAAVWNDTGYVSFILQKDTFGGFFHKNFFDAPLDLGRLLTVPAVSLAEMLRFLVTEEDFVVVKMDVEGTEWTLMRHLAETGTFDLIDELFLECHHGEYVPGWSSAHSLKDCHRLFNSLRANGVYAHEWY